MSNELDLNTTQETPSPLASPVNNKPAENTTDDAAPAAASDSESVSNSNQQQNALDLSVGSKSSESHIQNKRKKNQPIKSSSLLLLKCVEETNVEEADEEDGQEPIADIEEDVQVEDEGVMDQLEDEVEEQLEDPIETNDFVDENEQDLNGIDEEDEEEGSFEMESNYDDYNTNDNQDLKMGNQDEADVSEKQSIKKKHSSSSKSHYASNSNGISDMIHQNLPLANNAFLNNRNMELFAQTFLEKHQQQQQQQQQTPLIKNYNQHHQQQQQQSSNQPQSSSSKKQMRFQCRFCVYKSHSVSLMQNHIYRHIDTTPYSCFYCGHKSTTKSTIMVHIELCHPNMEVKIKESRVKEEDYYIDLNSSASNEPNNNSSSATKSIEFLKENKHSLNKFEIIPNKCQMSESQQHQNQQQNQECPPPPPPPVQSQQQQQQPTSLSSLSSASLSSTVSNSSSPSSTTSSISSLCSSPSVSPVPTNNNTSANSKETTASSNTGTDNDNLLLQVNPEHLKNGGFSANHQFENDDESTNTSSNNNNSGVTVFNRPKQYFGSLYEPDKQYSCKLCTYTTNHKPSMEDHVYVHTNKRPYRCGYCDEEIYTRYAATYHNKYKHPGEPRNFIKDEQDVSIYYVNRAKNGSSNANGTGKESMASNDSHNRQNTTNDNSSHANNDSTDNENNSGANFHQYGVVAQHRVLDSKQRCGPEVNTKASNNESKKSQSTSQHHPHHRNNHKSSSSNSNKLQSPNSSVGSPQSNNNDLIKVTSFRSANQQNKPTNKTNKQKYHNESSQQSDTLSHSDQSHLLTQNPLAFNAFNQFQPGSPSSNNSTPNIASALTQFMLAQGISPQQHQLQSLLTGMNPLAQSFNSTTPSPSSSTNSNSSSLSTSPSTSSSNNANNMYDFNLALKMYQIQLQSMMTANYLQSFNSATSSSQQLAINGQKKRKHHETIDHNNNNNGNESDEGSAYSQPQSPRHNGKVKFNSGANKKMSKNTV